MALTDAVFALINAGLIGPEHIYTCFHMENDSFFTLMYHMFSTLRSVDQKSGLGRYGRS